LYEVINSNPCTTEIKIVLEFKRTRNKKIENKKRTRDSRRKKETYSGPI
jgi:hypothetical protein